MSTEDELYGGETPLPDPEQRICDCTGRTAGQIEATLRRAGSRHPDTLRRHCGSGHQCGGCRPRIERIAATLSLPEVPPKPGLSWNRILRQTHLWASALACSLLLFFACTGFILNHRDAFGLDSVTRSDATLQLEISALAKPEADFLAVHLRRLGLRGEVSDCSIDDERITLRLESLGESHDVSIDLSSAPRFHCPQRPEPLFCPPRLPPPCLAALRRRNPPLDCHLPRLALSSACPHQQRSSTEIDGVSDSPGFFLTSGRLWSYLGESCKPIPGVQT
ncbi:MAG: putative PepSY TM-like [Verrucomicrobiota bacterium]